MSLLSSRSLHLQLDNQCVHGQLYSGWFTKKSVVRAKTTIAPLGTEGGVLDSSMDTHRELRQAINAVVGELIHLEQKNGTATLVSLSNSYSHFDVVSGDYRGASDRNLDAIATACAEEMLGDSASRQVIRWQLQPDMKHLLISSIDRHLLDSISEAASSTRVSIQSIQPEFCGAWNRASKDVESGNSIFAMFRADHFLVAFSQQGNITALTSGTPDFGADPDASVDRLIASLGFAPGAVSSFLVVKHEDNDLSFSSRWQVVSPVGELA